MKLLRVHIISAETCGGLLDGLDLQLREKDCEFTKFDPLCFIGRNGSGKSQFLQILAEILQSILHSSVKEEERSECNPELLFEIEYLIRPTQESEPVHVRILRKAEKKRRLPILIQTFLEGKWVNCDPNLRSTIDLLPKKVIGYTSGNNETLSLPFLVSRSGYADEVGRAALNKAKLQTEIVDARLMLIDYETHLEVLAANLLLGSKDQHNELLNDANLSKLHSFRCIVQLNHGITPNITSTKKGREGIQLTSELELYIENLRRCATSYSHDEKSDTYIFDFWVNEGTKAAFRSFWSSTFELYTSLHKLAMLNDLAIPKRTRTRFRNDTKTRRFASRLPEPQDEDKIFRFEQVCFISKKKKNVVDYVSLSDGEHQLEQLLGTFCMVASPNVLFLLDEPESHFNPAWRVKFFSRILDFPTVNGIRREQSIVAEQECLVTTHSPFVPSDMSREKVFIFTKSEGGKILVNRPQIETYGSTFDTILEECFGIRPPISDIPRDEIGELMKSDDPQEILEGINRLGHSVEKMFLADRLRQVKSSRSE